MPKPSTAAAPPSARGRCTPLMFLISGQCNSHSSHLKHSQIPHVPTLGGRHKANLTIERRVYKNRKSARHGVEMRPITCVYITPKDRARRAQSFDDLYSGAWLHIDPVSGRFPSLKNRPRNGDVDLLATSETPHFRKLSGDANIACGDIWDCCVATMQNQQGRAAPPGVLLHIQIYQKLWRIRKQRQRQPEAPNLAAQTISKYYVSVTSYHTLTVDCQCGMRADTALP